MELKKVEINGFKRFDEKTYMLFEGKVTAIVGPNEAGKTSFLKALLHWNHGLEFNETSELSKDKSHYDPNHKIVTCYFKIEEKDHKKLKDIPEASRLKRFTEAKTKDAKVIRILSPEILRDKTRRNTQLEILKKLRLSKTINFDQRFFDTAQDNQLITEEESALDKAELILESVREDLAPEELILLSDIANIVGKIDRKNSDPKYMRLFASTLLELIVYEEDKHPE